MVRNTCLDPRVDARDFVAVGWFWMGLLGAPLACAAPGDLDPSFGEAGRLLLANSDFDQHASSVIQQSDGKLVVAGTRSTEGPFGGDFIIVRLNSDGSSDASFGIGGLAVVDFNGFHDFANGIVAQGDGKLVIAGCAETSAGGFAIALVRLAADGTPDPTFGTGGKVTHHLHQLPGEECADGLIRQADGRLVVAGTDFTTFPTQLVFARFNTDGSLDTTFGDGGTTRIHAAFHSLGAFALVQQADGKLLAAGWHAPKGTAHSDFSVVRVTPNGALDPSFDGDGIAVIDFGGSYEYARSVAMQSDGKIVVVGTAQSAAGEWRAAVVRLNDGGGLDATFGSGGKALFDLGDQNYLNSVVVQPDGKLIATGVRGLVLFESVPPGDMILVCFNTDGSVDTSFGVDGVLTVDFSIGSEQAGAIGSALAWQSDGRLVAVGHARTSGSRSALAVARFGEGGPSPGFIGIFGPQQVFESSGTIAFTVRRTGGSTGTVSVDYKAEAGQAQPGSDFVEASGTLIWSDGDATDKTVNVTVVLDAVPEADEDFSVTLFPPTGGARLAASSATVTIRDSASSGNGPPPNGGAGTGGGGAYALADVLAILVALLIAAARRGTATMSLSGAGIAAARCRTRVQA